MSAHPAPVFVGGTGRSGTTVLGRLLGKHSGHATIPLEVRFHAEPRGLPSVVVGSVDPAAWAKTVHDRWYVAHEHPRHPTAGLHSILDEALLRRSLDVFVAVAQQDRAAACRGLLSSILDPVAAAEGKPNWVEMTPRNVFYGKHLLTWFPGAKLIHVVRDGRDVASSLVALGWVRDPLSGLEWWSKRLRQAHQRTRTLDPTQLHAVRFEDLLLRDRGPTYAALLDFLDWDDEPTLQRFFSEQMNPDRAHIGRWRHQLSPREAAALDKRYNELTEELSGDSVLS